MNKTKDSAVLPTLPTATTTWAHAPVGDLCHVIRGVTYKKDQMSEAPKKGYLPILRATNIQENGLVLDKDLIYVPEELIDETQRLRPGDVVVATSSGSKHLVGKTAQIRSAWDGSFGAFCAAVRPKVNIDHRYLGYYLQSPAYKSFIRARALGVNINNLRRGDLEEIVVPIAPPKQQHLIVSEIEKQFSRLDEAVAGLERIKTNLKRYKAAVLKAAVEGKLTEAWRKAHPNVETGAELLKRILAERKKKWEEKNPGKKYKEPVAADISNQPKLPAGWVWASVDQISLVVRGASPRPAGDPKYFGGTIPWITVGPLTADEQPYLHAVPESVTEDGRKRSRYVDPQTLLLTNSGATLGVPKITLIGGCINDGVAALLDVEYPLKLYLLYFLRTLTERLRGINQGAAQPNLNTTIIKAIVVLLPPRNEQELIVDEVDRRLSLVREVETQVDANLKRAQHLRQSILKCAFGGRLKVLI
jgi:type I restriction enzyme S subunit